MGTCKTWEEEDDEEAREEKEEEAGKEDALLLKTKTPFLIEPETRRLTVTVETKGHTLSHRLHSRALLLSRARCLTRLRTRGGTARTAPLFRC